MRQLEKLGVSVDVREVCAELEKIGRSGEMTGAAKLVDELVAEYERAVRALGELHQA